MCTLPVLQMKRQPARPEEENKASWEFCPSLTASYAEKRVCTFVYVLQPLREIEGRTQEERSYLGQCGLNSPFLQTPTSRWLRAAYKILFLVSINVLETRNSFFFILALCKLMKKRKGKQNKTSELKILVAIVGMCVFVWSEFLLVHFLSVAM